MDIANRPRLTLAALLAGAALVAAPAPAVADPIDVIVTLDTTELVGHAAGPFRLDFQLNQGDPGTAANTATLFAFDFGGGAATGAPTLSGGATGSLAASVVINDTGPFNTFTQGFTPGSSLSFRLQLTDNAEPGAFGDLFTFAILDAVGELPTMDSFFNTFLTIDLAQGGPVIDTFGSDPSQSPANGGPPVNIAAPTLTSPTAVPEPASLAMAAFGIAGAAIVGLRRRRRSRAA